MFYGRLSSGLVTLMGVWYCGGSDWSSTLECSHVSLKDSFSLNQHAQKVGRIGRCLNMRRQRHKDIFCLNTWSVMSLHHIQFHGCPSARGFRCA